MFVGRSEAGGQAFPLSLCHILCFCVAWSPVAQGTARGITFSLFFLTQGYSRRRSWIGVANSWRLWFSTFGPRYIFQHPSHYKTNLFFAYSTPLHTGTYTVPTLSWGFGAIRTSFTDRAT
jgi:hypothetical protein